jgi:hypothetical protein
MLVVSAVGYLVYAIIILGRARSTPLVEVPYVATLLWTIGIAIAATILLTLLVVAQARQDAGKDDPRDREINRLGEYIGQSFVAIGGVASLVMAMFELEHFWIANGLYLAFALSAVTGSTAKIFAFRRGFQSW